MTNTDKTPQEQQAEAAEALMEMLKDWGNSETEVTELTAGTPVADGGTPAFRLIEQAVARLLIALGASEETVHEAMSHMADGSPADEAIRYANGED